VRGKGFIKRKNTAISGIVHQEQLLMKSSHRIHAIQQPIVLRIGVT
jgi:redox-sensitive bicupin YhaK (pirin superfamily)